jgi:glycosyltransferase involved in cell wall biosynthesis
MKIRIVTPTYNEEKNIYVLHEKIKLIMSKLDLEYEHVVIDNASTDNTVKYIREIAQSDTKFKAILNNKNYGQIKSPFYGLIDSDADATILMVSDLQDPIEMIPELINEYKKGYQIVLLQKKFNNETVFYKFIKDSYYKFLNNLSDHSPARNVIGSGIYDSSAVNILKKIYDPTPYLRGLIYELGFNIKLIQFEQPKRNKGISKNNFLTLLDYGILGIVKHTKLARFLTIFGFSLSFLSLFCAFIFFLLKIFFWESFSLGIAPLIIGLFSLSGIQMFFLGLIGEYVIVILDYNKRLPLVLEKERINF